MKKKWIKFVPYSRKNWQFGGLTQTKIHETFFIVLYLYTYNDDTIPYCQVEKSSNISESYGPNHKIFQLYSSYMHASNDTTCIVLKLTELLLFIG